MKEAPRVTLAQVEAAIREETYTLLPNGRTTVCQLTLIDNGDTGFTVEGLSACVSRANYDEALGKKYSRERAIDAAWGYLGFLLADKIRHANDPPKFRDSETGEYVTAEYAAANPTTTQEDNS